MAKKLFVGNLDYSVNTEDLRNHFLSAGNLVDCVVIFNKKTGRSKGYGFVEFETEEDAQKAVETLNDTEIKGRPIRISEARPMEVRDPALLKDAQENGGDEETPEES